MVQEDFPLLQLDLHERTITHQLAVHLTTEFPDWDVDCEYNRREYNVKRIDQILSSFFADGSKGNCREVYEERSVYPDIIVHQRGQDKNLLVIEVKKNNRDDSADKPKLQEYLVQVQYRYATLCQSCAHERTAPNDSRHSVRLITGQIFQPEDKCPTTKGVNWLGILSNTDRADDPQWCYNSTIGILKRVAKMQIIGHHMLNTVWQVSGAE